MGYHVSDRIIGDGSSVYDAQNDIAYIFGGRSSRTSSIPYPDVLRAAFSTDPAIHTLGETFNMPNPRYASEAVLIRNHLKPVAGVLSAAFRGSEAYEQTRAFVLFGYEANRALSNAVNVFNVTAPALPFWEI